MELHLLSENGDSAMLAIRGQINQSFVHPERTIEFEELMGPDVWKQTALIDLSDATFVDSCGIGWLISSHKRFAAGGGRMVLHSLSPVVDRILGMIKLGTVVTISGNETEARNLVEGAEA